MSFCISSSRWTSKAGLVCCLRSEAKALPASVSDPKRICSVRPAGNAAESFLAFLGLKILYSASTTKMSKQRFRDAFISHISRGHCSHLRAFVVLPCVRPSLVKSCEHSLRFPCRGRAPPANRCHALHLGGNCVRRRRRGEVSTLPSFCTSLPQDGLHPRVTLLVGARPMQPMTLPCGEIFL